MLIAGMTGADPDFAKARDTVDNTLPKFLNYLEDQLGDREVFVQDRLTLADISVATPCVNMDHAGFSADADRWPKPTGFLERMHGRDSFAACISQERQMLSL